MLFFFSLKQQILFKIKKSSCHSLQSPFKGNNVQQLCFSMSFSCHYFSERIMRLELTNFILYLQWKQSIRVDVHPSDIKKRSRAWFYSLIAVKDAGRGERRRGGQTDRQTDRERGTVMRTSDWIQQMCSQTFKNCYLEVAHESQKSLLFVVKKEANDTKKKRWIQIFYKEGQIFA